LAEALLENIRAVNVSWASYGSQAQALDLCIYAQEVCSPQKLHHALNITVTAYSRLRVG
jgi:hypothetical protein